MKIEKGIILKAKPKIMAFLTLVDTLTLKGYIAALFLEIIILILFHHLEKNERYLKFQSKKSCVKR